MRICTLQDSEVVVCEDTWIAQGHGFTLSYWGMVRLSEMMGKKIYSFVRKGGSRPDYPTFISHYGEKTEYIPRYCRNPTQNLSHQHSKVELVDGYFSYFSKTNPVNNFVVDVIRDMPEIAEEKNWIMKRPRVFTRMDDGLYYREVDEKYVVGNGLGDYIELFWSGDRVYLRTDVSKFHVASWDVENGGWV